MDAKELRIGNHIGLNLKEFSENYFTVVELAEESAVMTDGLEWHPIRDRQYFSPEDCEGIPLTPEWVKKFGLVDVSGDKNGMAYRMTIGKTGIDVAWYVLDGYLRLQTTGSGWTWQMPHIIYVHQLQNLYYALTGSELLISDPKK